MNERRIGWAWALGISLAAGCAGDGAGAEGTASGGTTDSAGDEAPTVPAEAGPIVWEEMSHQERGDYMANVVVPTLEPLFQDHDPEEFADFGCATCHGDNARDVDFEMPNGLAPLNPAHIPEMFQSEQPMAVFMTQTVWPKMTELLGREPYDPETHEGFSCLNCHATAEE